VRRIAVLTALFFSMGVAAAATPNACQVLTPRDVARVQGAKYKKTRLTESSDSGVTISQCFYALPHLSDSVTVDLIRGQAREFWQKHFADINEASVLSVSREPEEDQNRPRVVTGIGEKAVWTGNRMAGALYVLSGQTVVRVSVGGGGSEEQKIEHAKRLAERAVRRL
jgi:hypothetical protein